MKKIWILLVLLLISAACTPAPLVPPETPVPTATMTPEPGPPDEITPTLPASEVPEEILRLAYDDLAIRLNVKWAEISLVSGEQVDFPDGCLGVHTPGVGCTDVITPGYRIQLQAGGSVYTYVTDLKGSAVILAEAAGPAVKTTPMYDRVVLDWSRNGGIAGFCDQIQIFASGLVKVTSCKADLRSFQLTAEQKALLDGWLAKYGAVEYLDDNPDALADRMTVKLILDGKGKVKPGEADLAGLLAFASEISLKP